MGKRHLVVFVVLIASLVPFRTAPQSIQISQAQNLQMCLEGVSECRLIGRLHCMFPNHR